MTRSTRPGALKSEASSSVAAIAGAAGTQSTGNHEQARFGQINFINSLPLTIPLLAARSFGKVDFTLGTPAELNHQFFDGKLDLGAMSSFFFLESGCFSLVPNISIASKGAVGSVLFFANRPPQELRSEVLAITSDSATSVNLLKVLFAETYGFIPKCETVSCPEIDDEHAGALVIGDRALHSDISWSKDLVRMDLGQWWFEKFQLPMVFGVWAARKTWVERNQKSFESICPELRNLFDEGLHGRFEDVLAEAQKRTGLPKPRLEYYYRHELNFELSASHLQGLKLYRNLCIKHRLLAESADAV
jgi:chorismate dehydratase